ncbi:MAG: pseudouridine synthase [Saprospiraceae bacterium]
MRLLPQIRLTLPAMPDPVFPPFDILFEDEHFVAINKPPGILVHLTRLSEDTVSVAQQLAAQLGQRIFPIHRLDRGTSGVLIVGKTAAAAGALAAHFREKSVEKKYLAVLRGYIPETATIDYALDDPETGKEKQPAVSHYRRLGQVELPFSVDPKFATTRYALAEAEPETGRRHQLRKHFAHIFHPVIGDRRHGDVKHNNYLRTAFCLQRLLLHAHRLRFEHPFTSLDVNIEAPVDQAFTDALLFLQLSQFLPPSAQRPAPAQPA